MLIPLTHFGQDVRVEDAAHGRKTHEDSRFDVFDHFRQSLDLLAVVVVAREVHLVIGQLVASVVGDETFGVDEPETATGFVLGQALAGEEFDNLFGDADAGAAGAEEDGSLVFGGHAGALDGVDDAGEDDGAGALDVVVEAGVLVSVSFQSREGVLEVFELDHDAVRR